VKVEDIQKEVPWDLKIAGDLSQTEAPTTEEIDFIRRFSPGMSAGRQLAQHLMMANIMKKMAARTQT
jgi:glutaconate CoA-transferase subunit B